MLDNVHVEGFTAEGAAILTWSVPPSLFVALLDWNASEREDDGCGE